MEQNISNQQSPILPSQKSYFIYLIVIIVLTTFVLGGAGGYLFNSKPATKQTTEPSPQVAKTSSDSQGAGQFKNITYLMKYRDAGPVNEKTIFITKDNTGENLKIADINMSSSSIKSIYKFDFPSAIGFNPPIFIVNNHIVVPVAGADANDILIFTLNGDVVSKGLSQGNTELSNWIVSYGELVKDNIIKVKLFQIDNSAGTAQIDISTGKMVPGSLVKLGKVQQ